MRIPVSPEAKAAAPNVTPKRQNLAKKENAKNSNAELLRVGKNCCAPLCFDSMDDEGQKQAVVVKYKPT